GGTALALTTFSGGSPKVLQVPRSQAPAAPVEARPTPTPHKPPKPRPKPKPEPVDIRDEKKDAKPLTIGEAFPARKITLAGHTFILAKAIINDSCMWTAYGPFAQELTWQHCRRVVRATFVSDDKKMAVTTGIAAMPTDAAAKAVMTAQD